MGGKRRAEVRSEGRSSSQAKTGAYNSDLDGRPYQQLADRLVASNIDANATFKMVFHAKAGAVALILLRRRVLKHPRGFCPHPGYNLANTRSFRSTADKLDDTPAFARRSGHACPNDIDAAAGSFTCHEVVDQRPNFAQLNKQPDQRTIPPNCISKAPMVSGHDSYTSFADGGGRQKGRPK